MLYNNSRDFFIAKSAKIRKATADKDKTLPQLIDEANASLQEERRLQTMTKSADLFYKSFIKTGESKKCCPLCDRGFPKDAEFREFLRCLSLSYYNFLSFIYCFKAIWSKEWHPSPSLCNRLHKKLRKLRRIISGY